MTHPYRTPSRPNHEPERVRRRIAWSWAPPVSLDLLLNVTLWVVVLWISLR